MNLSRGLGLPPPQDVGEGALYDSALVLPLLSNQVKIVIFSFFYVSFKYFAPTFLVTI